jgi:hypothetical protein
MQEQDQLSFDKHLRDYEAYQRQRRRNFIARMEYKHQHKRSWLARVAESF